METKEEYINVLLNDPRFHKAIQLFNSTDWYQAHDAFEELWHETNGIERIVLQGVLQIAVAQVHLERGNKNGATILYGEGLGRLRAHGLPDLGLDLEGFCCLVEMRLRILQQEGDLQTCNLPVLNKKETI